MTAAGARSASNGGAPIGGLAEEAAQLLDAVTARLALVRLTLVDREPADAEPADAGPADAGPVYAGPADAKSPDAGLADAHPTDAPPRIDDEQHIGAPGDPVPAAAEGPEPATRHAQCVGWCPLCRSADLLRGERPEVAGKLLDSAMVVVSALRSLLPAMPATDHSSTDQSAADHSADDTSASGPAGSRPAAARPTASRPAAPTGRSGGTPPPPGIERIDIR